MLNNFDADEEEENYLPLAELLWRWVGCFYLRWTRGIVSAAKRMRFFIVLRPRSAQLFCGPGFVINCWPATYIIDFPKRKPTSNLMARNKCTAARDEQKTLVLSIVSHTAVSLATHVGDFSFLRNAFFFSAPFIYLDQWALFYSFPAAGALLHSLSAWSASTVIK